MKNLFKAVFVCMIVFSSPSGVQAGDGEEIFGSTTNASAQPFALIGDTSSSMNKAWGAVAVATTSSSIEANIVLDEKAPLVASKKALIKCKEQGVGDCHVIAMFTGCLHVALGFKRINAEQKQPTYMFDVDQHAVVKQCSAAGHISCRLSSGGCTNGVSPEKTFILGRQDNP